MTYIFLLVILITLYSLLAIVRTRLNLTRRAILHHGGEFNPAEFCMGYIDRQTTRPQQNDPNNTHLPNRAAFLGILPRQVRRE